MVLFLGLLLNSYRYCDLFRLIKKRTSLDIVLFLNIVSTQCCIRKIKRILSYFRTEHWRHLIQKSFQVDSVMFGGLLVVRQTKVKFGNVISFTSNK